MIKQYFLLSFSIFIFFFAGNLHSKDKIIDPLEHEFRVYSQNGEDGVIQLIFYCIGTTSEYYVEFGTQNGLECNTRFLREQLGWKGLLMDGDWDIPEINLKKEFITADNINSLFEKYHVPDEFDLLSIDIDFNDFYIWHALSSKYRPRVVVIEYNGAYYPNEDKVVIYNPNYMWDYTNYSGASILALYNLGRSKGYSLVYANANGVNLFFIRDDVLKKLEKSGIRFLNTNNVQGIYKPSTYGIGPNRGHPQDSLNRPYTSSKAILENSSY